MPEEMVTTPISTNICAEKRPVQQSSVCFPNLTNMRISP